MPGLPGNLAMSTVRSGKCPYPACKVHVETDYLPFACTDHRDMVAVINKRKGEELHRRKAEKQQEERP